MDDPEQPNWKACWIWHKGDPFTPNTYVYLRRGFFLDAAPSKAVCRVSADTHYKLYLNGQYLGNGPVLTEPRWQSYDAYDITDRLRVGENVIAAIAYHYGNAIDNPDGYTANWSRGGFLCQIDMQRAGEKTE